MQQNFLSLHHKWSILSTQERISRSLWHAWFNTCPIHYSVDFFHSETPIQRTKYKAHHHVMLLTWISLSLTICLYHPLLLAGPPLYILCPYRAFVDKFLFVSQHFMSVWRGPLENITDEFVLTTPVMSYMSGSYYLDAFRDGWLVAVELQDLFSIAHSILTLFLFSFFLIRFVRVHVGHQK